jgi:methionyl-tRNA formyltransferase
MITISHNNNPYRPLVKVLTDVVFLTLPAFKEVCLHILEKHAVEDMRYHFAFDRHIPTLSQESSLLISLGTSVIVKQHELDCFTLAYNFHPAPPEYRGSQPYHFALYEKATHYGATCHEMDLYIDHGPIVYVDRFEILPGHTSMDLLHYSLHQLFAMMENLFHVLLQEQRIV